MAHAIPADAKFITGTQAIESGRWPFKRFAFYEHVKSGRITPYYPYKGANPVYRVDEIDALFRRDFNAT